MNRNGFSLIELMVTVAIAGILMAVAAPSFQSMTANSKIKTYRDSLQKAIQYARSEAVGSGFSVSVCPSNDPSTNVCAGTTDWTDGWIVFVDTSTGGTPTVANVLNRFETDGAHTITFNPTSASNDKFFRFLPDGRMDSQVKSGLIQFCDPLGVADARTLHVSPTTGQVRTGTKAEASC